MTTALGIWIARLGGIGIGAGLGWALAVLTPGATRAADEDGNAGASAPRILESRLKISDAPPGHRQEPVATETTTAGLRVERTRHVDASEPDAQGQYDYRYEYDIYRFTDTNSGASLTVRSYTDTPRQASFMRLEPDPGKPPRLLSDADLGSPLFQAACAYLRAHGKTDLRWLSGRGDGYSAVPEP